jgi:RsmE family RNA methyltransferase
VLASTPDELRLSFTPHGPPPAPLGIDLLLAVPRPKVLRRVLAAAASLGVKRIALVNAARTEKAYFDSPLATEAAMREATVLGLEQARDTVLPEVLVRKRFRPFVEDEAAALWGDAVRLVAHPGAARTLASCGAEPERRRVVAVGPEGGWVPFEVGLLEAAGFLPVSAGDRILRVDVAVPVLLAQLDLVRRGR